MELSLPSSSLGTGVETGEPGEVIRVPCGFWKDAALVYPDGSAHEHAFRHKGLADVVRRAIGRPPDADLDIVFASELSGFVSGRYDRDVLGFSVYWHSHSEIVFALTGITHCLKLYVECGRHHEDGSPEIFGIPSIYLLTDNGRVTWPRQTICPGIVLSWPADLEVFVKRRSAKDRVDGTIALVPQSISSNSDWRKPIASALRWLSFPLFVARVSVVWRRLRRDASLSITGRALLDRCSVAAEKQRVRLLPEQGTLENFFLSQVCLCLLGEDSVAEELFGVLFTSAISPDYSFSLHARAMETACDLTRSLNHLYMTRDRLRELDVRLDDHDGFVSVASQYYDERARQVPARVIGEAGRVLRNFSVRGDLRAALAEIGLSPDRLCAPCSREDVACLLRL